MSEQESLIYHGTAVAWGCGAALLTGPSGSGKSDLAFRLVRHCNGAGREGKLGKAFLVSDDQTIIKRDKNLLIGSAPEKLRGLIELRGIGVQPIDYQAQSPLMLIVKLCPDEEIERLPKPQTIEFLGLERPIIRLNGFQASSLDKLLYIMEVLSETGELPRSAS